MQAWSRIYNPLNSIMMMLFVRVYAFVRELTLPFLSSLHLASSWALVFAIALLLNLLLSAAIGRIAENIWSRSVAAQDSVLIQDLESAAVIARHLAGRPLGRPASCVVDPGWPRRS